MSDFVSKYSINIYFRYASFAEFIITVLKLNWSELWNGTK